MSIMQGRQPTWPDVARPGDLVEGEPAEFWRGIVGQTRDVLRNANLTRAIETPLGQTVAYDLAIPVMDLYVHAWDLGAAVSADVEIPRRPYRVRPRLHRSATTRRSAQQRQGIRAPD